MMITKGVTAPELNLYNTDKVLVNLADYHNKKNVLLLFFPLAFTSTCTSELCSVRDNVKTYHNDTTEVFGISVDSVYCLAAYQEKLNLNYPLLSDFNKVASQQYGLLYESFSAMKLEGVSKRAAFLIDKEGVIQYCEILENANDVPDFNKIESAIQLLT